MPDFSNLYSLRIDNLRKKEGAILKKIRMISFFRLLNFLAICFAFAISFTDGVLFAIAGSLLVAIFIYLIRQYTQLSQGLAIIRILLKLNENEVKSSKGEDDSFDYSPGIDYSNHIYANDLDIFGTFSLFRKINRTTTINGKIKLVESLLNPTADNQSICKRREIISELADSVDFRQKFYALGLSSGEKPTDIPKLEVWVALPQFFSKKGLWLVIAGLLTSMTLAAIIYVVVAGPAYFVYVIMAFFLNTCFHQVFFRSKINQYLSRFGDFNQLFSTWSQLSLLITSKKFETPIGIEISNAIKGGGQALHDIANLNKLIGYRLNGLIIFIMNGICVFDIWFILQVENWRKRNDRHLFSWIDCIVQMDYYNSLANYKFNHPTFCEAELLDGSNKISAKRMGHPLIPSGQVVRNDLMIGITTKAHIITGSNMSGKSTFLKAVGINMILARNGLPVCAESFACSNLAIASCIKINDSLGENQSYFKAEITRLSQIMELLRCGRPYLILLDEILKGTNAIDKREGTRSFYRNLSNLNCLAMLATHDPEIGLLEEETPDRFKNFHFESYVVDSDITFDYLLRPGISNTKNASLLMRKLNLI